ncbi:MAG TPA: LPS export ABC transporter periplasmic protein LptC [Novosphingobium sp.]|nr:LPS export ABC transporter periplasmic protein LptC [Novosphingobium sp.]
MTARADRLRAARRANAAPGGPHDRIVRLAMTGLPAMVGGIVAVMIITPLFPRNEVSFLLDRTKVAITRDRLRVETARYRGQDDKGRPFVLTAGNAVQHSAHVPILNMNSIVAQLKLDSGPAQLTTKQADYNISQQRMLTQSPVQMQSSDGYHMTTSQVMIDLRTNTATGNGGVSGQLPQGHFTAQRIAVDFNTRIVKLDGRVGMQMQARRSH